MGRLVSSGSKEKKVDLIYSEQLLRVVISTFKGQKKIKIFLKHFSNCIEKLHKMAFIYRKVASSRLSRLGAHFWIFRLLMKGKFDAYVL